MHVCVHAVMCECVLVYVILCVRAGMCVWGTGDGRSGFNNTEFQFGKTEFWGRRAGQQCELTKCP